MKQISKEDLQPATTPGDGWFIIEAAGQHPARIDGQRFMQNLTPEVLAAVAAAGVPAEGLPIDRDHLSLDARNSTEALGWVRELAMCGGNLAARIEWTTLGLPLIQGHIYKHFSTVYPPDTEQVAEDAAFMAEAMRESTIDPSLPLRGYAEAGELRMESSAAEPQEEEDVVTNAAVRVFKRDNLGRFAVTGAVLKKNKGGRSSRGKKMLGKTGSPNLVEAGDSKRKTKRALVKAFDEAKEGKKVSTGYKMGSHEVTLAPGDKEHWGTHHAERKEHPKKISADKLAEMTMHAERKVEKRGSVTIREGDALLVFAPENQPTKTGNEAIKRKQKGKKVVGKNWYRTGGK